MTVLVCVAHPDDEVLGCGATIVKLSKKEKVITVIFSYGDAWPPWMVDKKDLIKTRVKESKLAGEILGVNKTYFLGLKDTRIALDWSVEKEKALHRLFEKYKPTKVFTHTARDKHKDHAAVNKIVNKELKKQELLGRKIKKYYFEINFWSFINAGEPLIVFDVSKTFNKKLEAIDIFESQKSLMTLLKPMVIAKAYFYGKEHGYERAEYYFKE